MTWLIKNEWDEYLTEHVVGCAYFSEKQREAKRFDDQGKAYRVARKWDCSTVVRLVAKQASPSESLGPAPGEDFGCICDEEGCPG